MILNKFMLTSAFVVLAYSGSATYAQQKSQTAGDFPNRPVRIVTSVPGGGNDLMSRILAQGITGPLGQPVIVDNRGGTNGPTDIVYKAPNDGYTLLEAGSDVWVAPLVRKTVYDPVKDFTPISLLAVSTNILVVHPSVPVKSVQDLIALAKSKPGGLNYSSDVVGASAHIGAELFKFMTGVNIVNVPYSSVGVSITSVVGGETQMKFATSASVVAFIKSGALRAVAVTSPKPSALFPGLPTIATTVPGYEIGGAQVVFAPTGTPPAIISRLNREIVRVLNQTDVKARILDAGLEVVGSTPEELTVRMKSEVTRLSKVIKDAGIRAD